MIALTHPAPLYEGKACSFSEYLDLPNDSFQYELVKGVLQMVPAPFFSHQQVVGKLYRLLDVYLETHPIGMVQLAPRDVKLADDLVYQPDLLYIARERLSINLQPYIDGAPDFIVEVLSRGTLGRDTRDKFAHYQQYGVQEYWIMNPDNVWNSEFYFLKNGQYQEMKIKKSQILSHVIQGFILDLSDLERRLRPFEQT